MSRTASLRSVCPDLPPTLQPMAITHAAPRTDKRAALLGAFAVYGCMPLAMMAMGKLIPEIQLKPKPTIVEPPIIELEPPTFAPRAGTVQATQPTPPQTQANLPAVPAMPSDPRPAVEDANVATPDNLNIQPSGPAFVGEPHGPTGPVGSNPSVGTPTGLGTGPGPVDVTSTGLQIVRQVDPLYPPVARAARIQGNVVLRMVVDERGYPIKADVLEGPPLLRAEAMRAAQQWQFVPARVGGQPMAATFLLTIKFRLI